MRFYPLSFIRWWQRIVLVMLGVRLYQDGDGSLGWEQTGWCGLGNALGMGLGTNWTMDWEQIEQWAGKQLGPAQAVWCLMGSG